MKRHPAMLLAVLTSVFLTTACHAVDRGTIYVGEDHSATDGINIETNAETYEGFKGHAFGIYVNGGAESTETKVGNNLTITTHGVAADGIRTNPSGLTNWQGAKGNIRVGDGLTINTYGLSADGINLNGYNKLYIGSGATIATHYDGAMVHSDGNAGEGAHAVRANFNSEIHIGDNLTATTEGNSSYAIYAAQGSGFPTASDGAKIYLGDGLRAATSGDKSYAAYVASKNGIIDIADNARLSTKGTLSHAAYVSSASGNISFGKDAELVTTGVSSDAAYATGSNSSINFGDSASLQTEAAGSHGAHTGHNSAKIEFAGGAEIVTSDETSYAIYAERGSVTSNLNGGTTAASGGKFNVSGDMVAVDGTIDLIMTDGSVFTGKTDVGNGNISLDTKSTIWNITGNSTMTNLAMNDSTVNFYNSPLGTTLTVENLGAGASDTGTFRMNTDIQSEAADMLIVTGVAQGDYVIDVLNNGGLMTSGSEITDLIRVNAGQSAAFTLDHEVELGGWLYTLHAPDQDTGENYSQTGDTWFLRATGRGTFPAGSAVNTFLASYLLNYAETNTLIQRMGDLRNSNYESGLWFRAHGGKFESNAKSFVRGFDLKYGGVHIGYDRKYDIGTDGDFYGGVMFGYSKGDLDYLKNGSGGVDSKMLGLYGTFIGQHGFYVDTVLKYQWMDNDFDTLDSAEELVSGGGVSTGGFGASVEFGKRIPFGKTQKSGWYAEPQIQLSYMRQDGGYFSASNGLRIGVEPFTSLLGRLGMLVGYETSDRNFYAKVSKVKEFDGDFSIYANGSPAYESYSGSWWVYGLGATAKVNAKNSIYLDVERTSGGSFRQPWAVKAGWRTEF